MTPLKIDKARPDFSQIILDLSEAKHIKVNLKTGQLEKTTAFQAFIEKCKGLLGLTDSTNKDLLAHKIYVYLENNRDSISPNLDKINKLCQHAGIMNEGKNFDGTPIQKKLAEEEAVGFKNLIPKKQSSPEIVTPSPKEHPFTPSFSALSAYIKKKYPKFEIEKYTSIADLQNKGLPFHFALQEKDYQLFIHLIEAGGDVTQLDAEGNNVLMIAAKNIVGVTQKEIDFSIIESLIKWNVNPLQRNHDGQYPLELLAECAAAPELEHILLSQFEHITDENRSAAVKMLHNTTNKDVVTILVSKGLDINTPDETGKPLLNKAVQHNDLNIVRFLIDNGANPQARPVGMKTPALDLAVVEKERLERLIANLSMAKNSIYHPSKQIKPPNEAGVAKPRILPILKNPILQDKINEAKEKLEKTQAIIALLRK